MVKANSKINKVKKKNIYIYIYMYERMVFALELGSLKQPKK